MDEILNTIKTTRKKVNLIKKKNKIKKKKKKKKKKKPRKERTKKNLNPKWRRNVYSGGQFFYLVFF